MNINNTLQNKNKITLVDYLSKENIKNQICNVVGKSDVQRFITSIISATNQNPELKDCTKQSILAAALLGETLKLSPSLQLGQYYMIPFYVKNQKKAQFVLGYKGYLQLAIRTGFYKKINVIAIKDGELIRYDPLEESIEVNLITDYEERENSETIGYYAYIEFMNGFRKSLYWSKSKMLKHAKKYSTAFNKDLDNGTKFSFWTSEFDAMAYKTMLRQILSKWGNLNFELQQAFESDMAIIEEDGSKTYVNNIINTNYDNKIDLNNNLNDNINNNIDFKQNNNIKDDNNKNNPYDALFN